MRKRDHPPQTLAVLAEQLGHRRFIAGYGLLDTRVIGEFIAGRHTTMITEDRRDNDALPLMGAAC